MFTASPVLSRGLAADACICEKGASVGMALCYIEIPDQVRDRFMNVPKAPVIRNKHRTAQPTAFGRQVTSLPHCIPAPAAVYG